MASWFRSLTQAFTGVASEDFNTWLSDNYEVSPPQVPYFFEDSLRSALARTQETGGHILVWLHGRKGPLTDTLVREVWRSPELLQLVEEHRLLCWAGDVWRAEPYDLAVALRAVSFPVLALLRPAPQRGGFVVDFVLQGEVQHRAVLQSLRRALQHQAAERQLRDMAQLLIRSAESQREELKRQRAQAELLAQQEAEEAPLLAGLYESQYGESHPEFLEGGFAEAVAEARRQGKLLLLWLRSTQNQAADEAFGTQVWPNEVVQAFVAEHFLVWAGDVDRWLGPMQLRQVLQLPAAPALVALRPASVYDVDGLGFLFGKVLDGQPCEHPAGTAWQVEGWLDASDPASVGDGEPVVHFLCGVGERWEQEQQAAEAEKVARERERLERRALREAQDAEFQESLRIDAERASAAAAAPSPAKPPALGPEAVAAAIAEAEKKPKEPTALELQRRATAAELWQKEGATGAAAASAGERCRLVLRLPSGKRCERSFLASDNVGAVYRWADCAGDLAALAEAGEGSASEGLEALFEVPEHFLLCVTFPRQPLTDREMDLRSAGLCPNAVLALTASEPDEG